MNGYIIILAAAAIVSLLLLLAVMRSRHRKQQLTLDIQYDVDKTKNVDEAIISKRVIGVNPGYEKRQYGLILFQVVAQTGQSFSGYALYKALFDAGFRYNEYHIFEYIENIDGENVSLFSLASITQPGTFKLGDIERYGCPGVSVFMQVDQPHVAIAFKIMMKKIEYLSDVLQGKVLDDKNQLCTQQYFNECCERIAAVCQRSSAEMVV